MQYEPEKIAQILKPFDNYIVSDPILDPEVDGQIIIFIDPTPRYTGQKRLTKFAFSRAIDQLTDLGFSVSVHLSDGEKFDLVSSLKFTLFKNYNHVLNNIFLNDNTENYSLWFELKGSPLEDARRELVGAARKAARAITKEAIEIQFLDDANQPTPSMTLGALRIIAPCSVAALGAYLREIGFDVPSSVWMRRELRKLTNRGLVLPLSNNSKFALTYSGLILLGSGKSRGSPDIRRALALARRGK